MGKKIFICQYILPVNRDIMDLKKVFNWIALVLVVVGGLNWGLVGLFQFDLVYALLGSIPLLQKIVYVLVGIAAIYMVYYAATEMKE